MFPILSALLILPALFAALIAFAPARSARGLALFGAAATFAVSLALWSIPGGDIDHPFVFEEQRTWLPGLGIHYHVGVDGASMLLILLTTLLQLLSVAFSFKYVSDRPKAFFALLMALETVMIGAFCALDLVLFYVFFEACLIPTYFLIGAWGGPRRIAAATKFFIYTVVGSLLMLVSIIGVFLYVRALPGGAGTFDYIALRDALAVTPVGGTAGLLMFAGFAIAFAIKAGVFPFHTWLPDAYAEAPTAATVLLSGVMAKLGTYGLYRFCLVLFPDAAHQFAPYMVALAVISIVYGALVASVQRDIKRVFAYSSVSHLGFVVLGLFAFTPQALSGALLQMVNHGITSGALFLIAGMLYERRGTTAIRAMGGLWEQMPLMGRLFLIVTLGSVALPLTNGFVGEFLILIGAYQTFPWAVAVATTGVIWSAVYMLGMFQRVMYGPVDNPANRRLRDVDSVETSVLLVLVALIFLIGVVPTLFTSRLDPGLQRALGVNAIPRSLAGKTRPGAVSP